MKIIVNKFIPFKGFIAMAFFNMIFWRKEYEDKLKNKSYTQIVVNHESIHAAQMKDFFPWIPIGGIIFYIIYVLEWFVRCFIHGYNNAYKNISFEKEAKANELFLDYLGKRKRFAMWRKK